VRRRLTLAIVSVVAGALLFAGLGSLLLVRRTAADETREELVRQAQQLAMSADDARRPGVVNLLRRVLRLEGFAVVGLTPDGRLMGPPLEALDDSDIQSARLLAGESVSGVRGSMAYAAVPILSARPPLAVVLTREVTGVSQGSGYLALSAGLALVAAVLVADRLSTRITKPLRDAEEATRRIAAGDLSARVPIEQRSEPELASLGRSINAMAADLERAKHQERQFLLSVSHDLRTPLTSIRGFAEAIADEATTDTPRAAQVIEAEARRLERLVGDLLDLANLEAHRFTLSVGQVDAGEVIVDTVEGFRPAATAAGVELAVRVRAEHDIDAVADAERLAQVVANLVENALKFAASRIEVTARRVGANVVLTVTDDGPGIPAEDLPHVFERLYQSARTPARQMGSGLGLAIVSELVSAMGGSVEVRSQPGATQVVVTLRARADTPVSSA
jgi:signal transduction histidine kinase